MFKTDRLQGASAKFPNLTIVVNKQNNQLVQIVDTTSKKGLLAYSVVTLGNRENIVLEEEILELYEGLLTYSLSINGMVPQILMEYLIENKHYKALISDGLLIINCTQEKFNILYEEYLKAETYFKIINTQINKY